MATTTAEKATIAKLMKLHTSKMKADRTAFYNHRASSTLNPTLQMTILSDSTSGYNFKVLFTIIYLLNTVLLFPIFLPFQKAGALSDDFQLQFLD